MVFNGIWEKRVSQASNADYDDFPDASKFSKEKFNNCLLFKDKDFEDATCKFSEEKLEAYRLYLDQHYSQESPPYMPEAVFFDDPLKFEELMKNAKRKKKIVALYAKIRAEHLKTVKIYYGNVFRHSCGIKVNRKWEFWKQSYTHEKLNHFFENYLINNSQGDYLHPDFPSKNFF